MLRRMLTVHASKSQSPGARRALTLAFALSAAGVCTFAAGRAQAGVTIETQRGPDGAATMYVEGNRMRMDGGDKTGTTTSVIMDGPSKKMIVIEDKKKVYTEIGQEDMKRMRAQVDAMRAQMEERMKTMPPEQRKQMEGMMAGLNAGKPGKPVVLKFEKLGQKKSVNGFSCDMYRVLRDGTAAEEDCLAPWGPKSIQKSDLAGLLKFAQEMAKSFGGAGAKDQLQFDQLDSYPGFPISRVPLSPTGERGVEEQVKSIKRGAIPATRFDIPAGYTKKDLPTSMGAAEPRH
jgi:hypothetical protein